MILCLSATKEMGKFVSGIFDNGVLKNTPYILSQAKKYLFEDDKYIIPIEFESEKSPQPEQKQCIFQIMPRVI